MERAPGTRPYWLTAFLDLPARVFDPATDFWAAVTGHPRSAARGPGAEFATLVPAEGAEYLKVQRIGGTPRIHLDVHVADVPATAELAADLGARVVADPGSGYLVLTSPSGFVFCLVAHKAGTPPPPAGWPGGHRSRVDQVALDLPRDVHGVEAAFWSALLDEPVRALSGDEFSAIDRRPGLPLRVLLHRLDEPSGRTRAHLDLATDDVPAEVARHVALGAELIAVRDGWTVLRDPARLPYCVTGRDPAEPSVSDRLSVPTSEPVGGA